MHKPLIVQLKINGIQLPFEVDTGAAVLLIYLETKQKFLKDVQIQETTVSLYIYTSQSIQVVGTMQVLVKYGDHMGKCKLFVVKGVGKFCKCSWSDAPITSKLSRYITNGILCNIASIDL